jgi:magnesium transporter
MLTAIALSEEDGWVEVDDLDKMSELIKTPGMLLWADADIATLTSHDIAVIAEEFGLAALAVEDALHPRQRPKLEAYETHLFAVVHQLDTIDDQLEASQISCFIGRRFILTLHAGGSRSLDETRARCIRSKKLADQGVSFFTHALMDVIVDDYQAIADKLEEDIEELEDTALKDPNAPLQSELYALKQKLARLRRYVLPGERVLAIVLEPDRFNLITKRTGELFRDVHDHSLRIIDQIRNVDDLVNAVIDLQRSEQAAEMNQTTKRLTGWAAIIAVPTFIASVYGMNFELIPNEGELLGFWFALGTMLVSGSSLYVYFKKRGWI